LQIDGEHRWATASSGSSGGALSFTTAMTLDASGNLGVGTSSPSARLDVDGTSRVIGYNSPASGAGVEIDYGVTANTGRIFAYDRSASAWKTMNFSGDILTYSTGGTERARITSDGNLLIGTTTNTARLTTVSAGAQGTIEVSFLNGGCEFFVNSSGGGNAAACVQRIGQNSTTSRSINAGGTINASGTDYAEYMEKASEFVVAKGDVCGVDAHGKLTNVYADAVAFVVKSTNPSYVGGDSWGADFKDDPEGLEEARQKVDRIAFSGQVPVNVLDATPGQYIVPVNDNGAIKGVAVSSPTFEQYQAAVGKVIAIEDDGRARIIVKVA
jgi:hypothetical protein